MDTTEACKPLSLADLLLLSELKDGICWHLPILYSLVVGTGAKVILDLGLGRTTGAIRAAAAHTGGIVNTCDFDSRRFRGLLSEQTASWRLFLEPSMSFLRRFDGPIDFVMHDAAHDYEHVRSDLIAIFPKMRRFGLVCVHDTQQPDLHGDMLGAIHDAIRHHSVSLVNLPFGSGLAIIRIEESAFPSIEPRSGFLSDGQSDTALVAFPMTTQLSHARQQVVRRSFSTMLRAWRVTFGHQLREKGLR